MNRTVSFKRRSIEALFHALAVIASFFAISILAVILIEVLRRGFSAIDADLFTKLPTPPGQEGGGLANAIAGSLVACSDFGRLIPGRYCELRFAT